MSFFVIFTVGGGGLFFAGILLLFILERSTELASDSILAFIDSHLIAIGIILGILTILITFFATKLYLNNSKAKKNPVWFSIGAFINVAEAAVNLILYVRAPFISMYNGWFLLLIRIAIAVVAYIAHIGITNFILSYVLVTNKIYLLYISMMIGLLFIRFALTSW